MQRHFSGTTGSGGSGLGLSQERKGPKRFLPWHSYPAHAVQPTIQFLTLHPFKLRHKSSLRRWTSLDLLSTPKTIPSLGNRGPAVLILSLGPRRNLGEGGQGVREGVLDPLST